MDEKTAVHDYKTCPCWMCTDLRRNISEEIAKQMQKLTRRERRYLEAQGRRQRRKR